MAAYLYALTTKQTSWSRSRILLELGISPMVAFLALFSGWFLPQDRLRIKAAHAPALGSFEKTSLWDIHKLRDKHELITVRVLL
jgi:hypothetical protein